MSWSGSKGVQGPPGQSKGCHTCSIQEIDCKIRWDYMREHGATSVNCWRPPGSILIWGEEYASTTE